MVDKIREAKGISCVEIFLLALLSRCGIDVRCLYMDSYIDLTDTVETFAAQKLRYAFYLGKPRLQTVAKERGLIDLSAYFDPGEEKNFDYSLYEVRPNYKGENRFAPWREDHYLLKIGPDYYDCRSPEKTAGLTESDFTGKRLGIKIKDVPLPPIEEIKDAVARSLPATAKKIAFEITPDNLNYVRDALLYVKVTRERMNAVLECPALARQIKALTKLIALTEIFRLRKKIGPYNQVIEELNETEVLWKRTTQRLL